MKRLNELSLEDFEDAPVWAVDGDGNSAPRRDLSEIPNDVAGLWVRLRGKLADETPIEGMAMVECPPPKLSQHVFMIGGKKYPLRFEADGVEDFSRAIGKEHGEVFPMYVRAEVKAACTGDNISQEIDITGPV